MDWPPPRAAEPGTSACGWGSPQCSIPARILIAALALASPCPALSQADVSKELADPDLVQGASMATEGLLAEDDRTSDKVIIPIPISQPALGTGFAVIGAFFHNPNSEPSPWVTGAGGGITSNGTWAVGAFHRMSLQQDRFRITGFLGFADANFKYFGIGPENGATGRYVDLDQRVALGLAEFKVRLARKGLLRKVLIGPRIRFAAMDATSDASLSEDSDLLLPESQRKSSIFMVGPAFTFDSRNHSFYPTKGVYINASLLFGTTLLGGNFTHRKIEIQGNTYFPIGPRTVLAVRKSACDVSGDAPFYDLCNFGQHSDLRGYETNRYRDGATWALQAEVRQSLSSRFGLVAFAGVGGIAESASDVWKHSYVLGSGGIGVRYMASKANKVNLRLDVAYGRDGAGIYFGIGEAF